MAFDLSSIGSPLDERYSSDIAAESLEALQALLPNWIPRNASPELIYLEAVALAVSDVVNSANATIAAVEEDILENFYQVPRLAGSSAGGQITVTFDSTVTTTIPAGTGFALADYGTPEADTRRRHAGFNAPPIRAIRTPCCAWGALMPRAMA